MASMTSRSVLTSRRFAIIDGVPNQLQYHDSVYGDTMITNGTINAQYTLPKQMVRLRLLTPRSSAITTSASTTGVRSTSSPPTVGLLSAPVPVTNLIIAPAERYEIAVDLTGDALGTLVDLEAQNGPDSGLKPGFAGFENAFVGELGSQLNYRTIRLLRINVGPASANAITSLPSRLANNAGLAELTLDHATLTRQLGINGGPPNGPFTVQRPVVRHGQDRPDDRARLHRSVDRRLRRRDQPFIPYSRRAVSSRRPQRRPRQRRRLGARLEGHGLHTDQPEHHLRHPLRRDGGRALSFMYHCHMINHEDEGLMGQFTVQ
jgi:hypothetical protein